MFLNPERNSLPDIDSDFSSHRRHEVIEYLQDKYGINHIANIGTYQTMTSKAILKNVSKVMGIDHNIVNEWNKNIPAPNGNVMPIGVAIEEIPVIKEASEEYPELFELAEELQKMPKSKGVHASGVQISPVELSSNLPLMVSRSGEVTTQYEGGPLEDIGYVKFDILGVKVLSVIELAINLIKERHNVTINIRELEPTDRNVFRLIKEGNTGFLFQIASPGMTDIFKQLNKVDFDSLIAGISLYRPGPMQFIPNYISRANGETEVTYATEELESILKPTFGVVVYQESVMEITKVLGGYSSGAADLFRKAIGKKSQKVMDEELPKLHKSIMDNGYSKDIADEVQNIIEPFIGYGLTN